MWISSLRKIQRILHPGILHVSGVETSIIHESDIPSSTFNGVFLSRPRYPFPSTVPFHLTNPTPAASSLARRSFRDYELLLPAFRLRSPSVVGSKTFLPFLPSRHRLFITARWYPARETALCCNTSPPARSYCHNCPDQHHSAYRRHHHLPPPPNPLEPCVCLNSNRQLCYRPPTSSSSSHEFYSGERIAVVICIWKLSKRARFGAWVCLYRSWVRYLTYKIHFILFYFLMCASSEIDRMKDAIETVAIQET